MTPAQAKRVAKKNGWEFWWDRDQRFWTMTKEDCTTSYHTAMTLEQIDEKTFVKCYVEDRS